MCGIAGILSANKIDKYRLETMSKTIAHRGPDGEGFWFNSNYTLGLAHRRLSIIDLSENGKQPMQYMDGRYTISFNGEIYNYIELKQDLIQKGYHFKSDSDTEVLLALYDLKKEECLQYLDGMFAFAIWDNQLQQLFCARDRFGEKPFYYNIDENGFKFCSEIKGLLAAGASKALNNVLLFSFLETAHVLHHPEHPEQTFYKNIYRLPKAHYLIIDLSLNFKIHQYWSLDKITANSTINFEEASAKFSALFSESISRRLRSDVPVGSSLSGGLDSSSIVSVIQQLGTKAQHTFSARFQNFHRDEGHFIDILTKDISVHKHFVWPDEQTFIDEFQKMLWHQDEPIGTASIYAQYAVMKKAKEEGITVLLDGQGADEILGGYEYYLGFYLKSIYKNAPSIYQKELAIMRGLHMHMTFKDLNLQSDNKNLPKANKRINPFLRIIKPEIYKRIKHNLPLPGYYTKDFVYDVSERIPMSYKGKYDLNDYLKYSVKQDNLEDLLRYSDRNSMAHDREVRLPFLSHELVEFLFTLPVEMKIHNGWTKYILRDAMKNIMPNEITWRVNKVGYEPPQSKWLQNKRISNLANDAFSALKDKRIIDQSSMLKEDQIWTVLATLNLL
jgi:asparagine synthase (glutamine-hydrolysing)